MSDDPGTFAQNLRTLVARRGSIAQVCRETQINRPQFMRYLNGQATPRIEVLRRIVTYFGVDARILLEPLDALEARRAQRLSDPVLQETALGSLMNNRQTALKDGWYRMYRKSFLNEGTYVCNFVRVFTEGGYTYLRGFDPIDTLIPGHPKSSLEFRGTVLRQDTSILILIGDRSSLTIETQCYTPDTLGSVMCWVGAAMLNMGRVPGGTTQSECVMIPIPPGLAEARKAVRDRGYYDFDALPQQVTRLLSR